MWGLSLVVASGGHSSSQCAGLSLLRPLVLRSTGSRRAGSVVVAHGPSCSMACGIFLDQGSNPCPLHWQANSQPLCHQGSPYLFIFWWTLSFRILAIVNNAAMNMGMQISLWDTDFNSFECIPRSGITRSYDSWIFNFLRNPPILLPPWLNQFIFSSTVYKGSLFPTSSLAVFTPCLFDNSCLNRYEVISHCGFYVHFPDD